MKLTSATVNRYKLLGVVVDFVWFASNFAAHNTAMDELWVSSIVYEGKCGVFRRVEGGPVCIQCNYLHKMMILQETDGKIG